MHYIKHKIVNVLFLIFCNFQFNALSNEITNNISLLCENQFKPNELAYYTDFTKFQNKYLLHFYPKNLFLFDSEFNQIEEISILNFDTSLKNYFIKLAGFDIDGNVLVFIEGKGLFRYFGNNSYSNLSSSNWLESTSVLAICPPIDKTQYIITSSGIAKNDGDKFQLDTISFNKANEFYDYFPHYNEFFYSLFGDNVVYKSLSGKLINYDGRIKNILSPNEISSSYKNFTFIDSYYDTFFGLATDGIDFAYFECDSNFNIQKKIYFSEMIDNWDSLRQYYFPAFIIKEDKNTFWIHLRNKSKPVDNLIIHKSKKQTLVLDVTNIFSLKSNYCTFFKNIEDKIFISIFDAQNYSAKLLVYNKYNSVYSDKFFNNVTLFPNPARSTTRISLQQEGDISISAVDVLGRSFPLWSGFATAGDMELEVSSLPTGTYTLLISYGTKVEAVKLIKN